MKKTTTFPTKHNFETSFTPREEARIRAALGSLDGALAMLGEAVAEDYDRAATVWHISRDDPFWLSVKATNIVMGVDIYGNSVDHLITKIGLVTDAVCRFGRHQQPTISPSRPTSHNVKEDRQSVRRARKAPAIASRCR